MKFSAFLSLLLLLLSLASCSVLKNVEDQDDQLLATSGPIEIDERTLVNEGGDQCSISGELLDENDEPVVLATIQLQGSNLGAYSDENGKFKLNNIPSGAQKLIISYVGMQTCNIDFPLKAGDQVSFVAHVSLQGQVELLKPIIYLYPTDTMDVQVKLDYAGTITTTYPKLPNEGWNITAFPDGTLMDKNKKEYYALYWEGEPRKPLGIEDGFVVSKEQTVPFLEDKLARLGLNAKESNEFIIFWLPILEKNAFNLIHFAGDDYLEQAQLSISPTPETIIRVTMVFQGLDETIEFPIQDLSKLEKTRKGFTVVEWGGQQLPKNYSLGI